MSKYKVEKKGKMYACLAYFPSGEVKKWKYVRDMQSFAQFLSKSHATWKYFNVYDKGTKAYLKRFYPGNMVPKVLGLLLLAVGLSLLTKRNTFSTTLTCTQQANLENTTLALPLTFNTLTNGIYNHATILTLEEKGGLL